MIRKHPVIASILVAVILAAVAFYVISQRESKTELVEVKRGSLTEAVYGIGTVTSRNIYRARVGTASGIERIFIREGDYVEKGRALLQLQDGVSIRTPVSGTVTSLPFHAGENVLPNDTIATVEDLSDLYVVATLEQLGALRVRPKMKVRLNFESLRSRTFDGEVKSVYPQKDQFLVSIQVAGLPPEVLPGMTADCAIQVATKTDALLIPERAITDGKVVVKSGDNTRKVEVTVGISDGQWAEIVSGELSEGDLVLLPKL